MNKRKEIVFAVPGSKKYINDFYRNSPDSFINYSLTGKNCELNCLHCKKILLDTMNLFNGSDETIKNITESNMKRRLKGILISGGFDAEGKLPINDFLKKISMLKKNCPNLKILVHSGFTSYKEAEKLKKSIYGEYLIQLLKSLD